MLPFSGKRKALLKSQPHMTPSSRFKNYATLKENDSPVENSLPNGNRSQEGKSLLDVDSSLEGNRSLEMKAISRHSSCSPSDTTRWQDVDLFHVFNSAAGLSRIRNCERARTAAACDINDSRAINLLQKWAQSSRMMGSPCTDKLLVLVKINVFRALISNSRTLGIPSEEIMDDDAISILCSPNRAVSRVLALPLALRPTDLQTNVAHHPWIDCLPVPRMRQNLIRAGDTFDVMKLCGDLVGLFSTGTGRTGIIVWGEPWDVAGWEVTEGFLKSWGWTIEGCWEIFESTNRCRAGRGEMTLCFDRFTI